MKKSKYVVMVIVVLAGMLLSSCADTFNKADFNGGLFTSSKSDYIVISQSGGKIMDVWKLKDSFVSSPYKSDGWIFKTNNGSVAVGDDAKVIRILDNDIWIKYHEYHMEYEYLSYREKYNNIRK